jgi:hypothetical protein
MGDAASGRGEKDTAGVFRRWRRTIRTIDMPVFPNFSTEASGIINRLSTSLPVRLRRCLQDLIQKNCPEAAALRGGK